MKTNPTNLGKILNRTLLYAKPKQLFKESTKQPKLRVVTKTTLKISCLEVDRDLE